MKSKLLGESQVNELLAVKSIEEVTGLLEESNYKEELVELSTKYSGVELINRAVELNFSRTIKKLSTFLPSNRSTFDLVLEEWTIQNLKAIIASKATGVPLTEAAIVKVNEEQNTLFTIANDPAIDLKKLIRKLSFMGHSGFSQVFRKIDHEYNGGEILDFRPMFKELDDYYYSKLATAAEKESVPAVKALLLAKVDLVNTMSLARLKLAGVSDNEIANNLVKGSRRLKRQADGLIEKGNIEEVVEEIVKMHKLAPDIADDFKATHSLVKLEVELQRKLVAKALRTSKVSVLSFAVMLAFIYLKQEEVSFIKAIAYSTQAGIREEIKNLVFAVK